MGFSTELLCVVSPLSSPEIQLLVSFCRYNCDKGNNKDWHFLLPFPTHSHPLPYPPSSLLLCSGPEHPSSDGSENWKKIRAETLRIERGEKLLLNERLEQSKEKRRKGPGSVGEFREMDKPSRDTGSWCVPCESPSLVTLKEGVHSQLSC